MKKKRLKLGIKGVLKNQFIDLIGFADSNALYWWVKELAGQSLFYCKDKMEESPGSIGQGAR